VEQDRNNGFLPFMVIATAGTTATGVIDPLPEIGKFCREQGLWLHVDAAWGGSAILAPSLKHHLAGIGDADSITCDAHKWLSVTMGCGMFFCRHPETVAEAFRADVSYMPSKKAGPVFDPFTNSAQWSRRFIGLKLFMSLAERGEAGYAEMLEHQTRMGDVLREALKASGWSILNSTPLPLVCFTREGLVPTEFLASLHKHQIAWMSQSRVGDIPVVRACITSFRTTEQDIHWVVSEMNRLIAVGDQEQFAGAGQGVNA
jgi:glutamate/tyrosine decarboxylase-like PLP-dependent enzyme